MTTILVTACEPSGDNMGAAFIRAVLAEHPGVRFIGGGGPAMAEAGLHDPLPTDKLAVMGVADALMALPRAKSLSSQLAKLAAEEKPDAAVLIDSWAFSKMAADVIKKASPETKLIKLAVPQVWASRPERALVASELFDKLLCLLPFEPSFFEEAGGDAEFIGNPNFQMVARAPKSGASFRAHHGLGAQPVLVVLPGSRGSEVKQLLPVFGETVEALTRNIPDLKVLVVTAPAVAERVKAVALGWQADVMLVGAQERFDAFDAADVALAASGTVTTELAMCGTPMTVAYKFGPITAYWARRVVTTPYVTVLNVAAGEEIIPERIQEDCNTPQLMADTMRLFTDAQERRKQLSAFRRLLPSLLGSEDAAKAAALSVLRLIDGEDRRDLDGGAAG